MILPFDSLSNFSAIRIPSHRLANGFRQSAKDVQAEVLEDIPKECRGNSYIEYHFLSFIMLLPR